MKGSAVKKLRYALIVDAVIAVCAVALPLLIDRFGSTIPAAWAGRGFSPPLSASGSLPYKPERGGSPRTMNYDLMLSHDSETGVATNTHVELITHSYAMDEAPAEVFSEAEAREEIRRVFVLLCQKDGNPELASAFDRFGQTSGGRITIEHPERKRLVSWRWFLVAVKDLSTLALFGSVIAFLALLVAWFAARRVARVGCCGACGYDLRGIAAGVCPECEGRSTVRS